jgi:hypothetical protein
MNAIEWRRKAELRQMAAEILAQPAMQEMVKAVEETNPAFLPRTITGQVDATFELGRIYGFTGALTLLRDLANPPPAPPEAIQTTWNAETGT